MRKSRTILETVKLKRGRPNTTGIPYAWVRVGNKEFRKLPYHEWKYEKMTRMLKALKDDEFIFLRGRIDGYKKRYGHLTEVEFYPWYQAGDSGFLAFHKGQIGKILDGKISLGKEGSVQKISGLPDFCETVSR